MPNIFADLVGSFLDSINNLLQDELEYLVDLLFGTILTVPRIETEGPLTFGRPDGQPLSEIGDFLTPSLFNTIAAESYEYVWVGAGGSITITALVMYLGMIMVSGQYEILQFNTSQKNAKNPIVGLLLILFWFPLYLLIIALSHGFVHAFVTVDQIIEVITSVMLTVVTGLGAIIGASTLGPAGAIIGIIITLLMISVSIIAILPYIFLVVIMVARSFFMGVYLLFSPFLIAGSWSGLPVVSKTCDKLLWKSIVIAVLPVVMVPVLYVVDLIFLPLFGGIAAEASGATVTSGVSGIDVGFSGAIAFAILGYGLVISVWVGFSKISPAAQRVGQTLFRSGVAAGIIGVGSQLGVGEKALSRTAEMTIRVGAIRGVGILASDAILDRRGGEDDGDSDDSSNGDSDGGGDESGNDGSRGGDESGNEEYEDGYQNTTFGRENWRDGGRNDQSSEPDPIDPEQSREYTTDVSEPDTDGYDIDTLRNNLILNPEAFDQSGWTENPEISEIRAREIARRLDEQGVGVNVFDRNPERYLDIPKGKSLRYGQPAKYAVAEVWKEEYSSGKNVRLGNDATSYELIDSPVDTESSTVDQPAPDDDLIHDPVDEAFEPDTTDSDSYTSTEEGSENFGGEYDTQYGGSEDGFDEDSYGGGTDTGRRYYGSDDVSEETDDASVEAHTETDDSERGDTDGGTLEQESNERVAESESESADDQTPLEQESDTKSSEGDESSTETQTQDAGSEVEDGYEDGYESNKDQYGDANYSDGIDNDTADRHEGSVGDEDPVDDLPEDEVNGDGDEDESEETEGGDDTTDIGTDPDDDKKSDSEKKTQTPDPDPNAQLSEKRSEEFYRIQQALKKNSTGDVSPATILAEAGAEPNVWFSVVSDAVGADNPIEALSVPAELRSG